MISGIVYDIEKCIYKKGIDIMKKRNLIIRFRYLRRYGVMAAWNDKQFPQITKNKELVKELFSYGIGNFVCIT
ncbi:MAG: hypothetical protein ACLUJR_12280 [Mediterraneibacter gnavus]